MDLDRLFVSVSKYTRGVCRRLKFTDPDDAVQEACIAIWQESKRRKITGNTLRAIGFRCAVDAIRFAKGRKQSHIFSMTLRDLQRVRDDVKDGEASVSDADYLDFIESNLEGRDLEVFRMLRGGLDTLEMSKALGITRKTAWAQSKNTMAKIAEVVEEEQG